MVEALRGSRLLLTTDAVGGVWTYSLDLAREVCARGIEVQLAVLGPAPSEEMADAAKSIEGLRITASALPLDWLAETPQQIIDAGEMIARMADERRCDLVQLHSPALAASGAFTMPVISVHHSCLLTWWRAVRPNVPLPDDFRWQAEMVARGLAASDAVVAPTTAHAHSVAAAYGLATSPLAIRNGRSVEDMEMADTAPRAPFVLTSGRLWDGGKNAATLDRAAGLLGVPVYAAGATAGPHGETRSFPSLRLLGSLPANEMRIWLSQTPIYASAAIYEPFGLGVLEAAQAGCALVLADNPVFRELWAGACLFAPPGDEHAYAREITRLLDDQRLLHRMSDRARRRSRHYSAASMAGEMMRLYANLLELHRIRHGAAA